MPYEIAAFYRFVRLPDYRFLHGHIQELAEKHRVLGTILVAEEGINGTICAPDGHIQAFFEELGAANEGLSNLEVKLSQAEKAPFQRLKIKAKREIVTLRKPEADPNNAVGVYVEPSEWNALISKRSVTTIDCRNDYEAEVGIFKGAIDPKTIDFCEFPEWAENNLPDKDAEIAMYCTGGIRCEKATAYLLAHGYKHVYHLKGGILNYFAQVPPEQSAFEGYCFVFDERRAVDHQLQPHPDKVKWIPKKHLLNEASLPTRTKTGSRSGLSFSCERSSEGEVARPSGATVEVPSDPSPPFPLSPKMGEGEDLLLEAASES